MWYVNWWKDFHTCLTPSQAWLDKMIGRIPCYDCKVGFMSIIQKNPPVFTAEEYFPWTVLIHNAVTLQLVPSAKTMTVEQARELWNVPA